MGNYSYISDMDQETETLEVTKKDLKILKRIMVEIESDICRSHPMNPTKQQEKDSRLKVLYKLLGYE